MNRINNFIKRIIKDDGTIVIPYSFGTIYASSEHNDDKNLSKFILELNNGEVHNINTCYLDYVNELSLLSGIEEIAESAVKSYLKYVIKNMSEINDYLNDDMNTGTISDTDF